MEFDFRIYMAGMPRQHHDLFCAPASPIVMEKGYGDWTRFASKKGVLDGFFVFSSVDAEEMDSDPMHAIVQQALGFTPESLLFYASCLPQKRKVPHIQELVQYVRNASIPFYAHANESSTGEHLLVRGYNPLTGAEIFDSRDDHLLPAMAPFLGGHAGTRRNLLG